jgi:cell division protein FtsQ
MRRDLALAAAIALAGFAFLILGDADRRLAALAQIEHTAERAGLGLQQVTLTGHRFTADSDIFDAIDLGHARTLLSFDARAAQARIERLPWIERASIERIVPDSIEVRVEERAPFAVWRSGDRHWLVDRTGRLLQPVPADAMPALPRVAGAGGASTAAALLGLLAVHPSIARRVELAERVGDRRWTLRLTGGTTVHLPADGEAAALARLARLIEAGLESAISIDLRVATRVLVRERRNGGEAEPGARGAPGRT